MNNTDVLIGIVGGFGLGLLLGREFSSKYITLIGAILIIISIASTAILSYRNKK